VAVYRRNKLAANNEKYIVLLTVVMFVYISCSSQGCPNSRLKKMWLLLRY